MKLAFIDCITNKIDPFEFVAKTFEEKAADLHPLRFTSPGLLKIPAACHRMFSEGAEAAIVYVNVAAENQDELNLVHNKIIDAEILSNKFVFLVAVFDEEWRTPKELDEVTEAKLAEAIELAVMTVNSPSSLAGEIKPPEPGAFDMFSTPETPETETTSSESQGRKLF